MPFKKKTWKILEIGKKFGKNLEELLKRDYVDKQMTAAAIGNQLGVSCSMVTYWLRKYGVPTRNAKEARWGHIKKPSKE